MKLSLRWVLAAWLTLMLSPVQASSPIVAAASSLQFAFPQLMAAFEADTGLGVRVNYGASGNFRRQIQQGAPFEVFLSADEFNIVALDDAGLLEEEGRVYAVGRLAWLQRADLPHAGAPLSGVQEALARHERGEDRLRIALANPEHAPYGVAARQALEHAGLWESSEPLRVFGENVSQAAQFALSDDARGGLVAESLALAPQLAERSDYVLIPDAWHEPLVQRMALVKGADDDARAFYTWLQGEGARKILSRYGFRLPDEAGDEIGEGNGAP